MKNLRVSLVVAMFAFFSVAAQAQDRTTVGDLIVSLITVNIDDIEVDVTTGDITLVNVENVLNNAEINVLNRSINNNSILSQNQIELTDVLQDFLNNNQIVVGILSDGRIVVQNL